MEYFIIHQDERITDAVQPAGLAKAINIDKLKKETNGAKDQLPLQIGVNEKNSNEYVDYLERPVPLVSDRLKQILEKYEEAMYFKPVVLTEIKAARQQLYWLMDPDSIDCLSEMSRFYENKTIKRLVIDPKKDRGKKIFKINGLLEKYIIITLDVAESILRRYFNGIRLEKVERES